MSPLSLALASFYACLCIAAASDLRRLLIPDWPLVAMVGAFLITAVWSGLDRETIFIHLGVGAAGFFVGWALFEAGLWGGGDGKMLAAASIWFDPVAAIYFLLYTTMAGGVLGLIAVAAIAFHANLGARLGWDLPLLHRLRSKAPYGVAIAAGAIIVFPATELHHTLAAL